MIDQKNYVSSCRVSRFQMVNDLDWWNFAKKRLMQNYIQGFFPEMIDDDKFHVMKFEYDRRASLIDDWIEFRLVCYHTVAEKERVVIFELPELPVMDVENYSLPERACQYCGNVLILDKRGACSACGGPAGKKV